MCHHWIEDGLQTRSMLHVPDWSTSLAVGSQAYVETVKEKLGVKARNRKIEEIDDRYSVREKSEAYDAYFDTKNHQLSVDNVYYLRDS